MIPIAHPPEWHRVERHRVGQSVRVKTRGNRVGRITGIGRDDLGNCHYAIKLTPVSAAEYSEYLHGRALLFFIAGADELQVIEA